MKMILAAAVLAAGTALSAATASAAPGSALGGIKANADSNLQLVHGRHQHCERGRAGWHRSPRDGVRIECRPRRPSGMYWSWRKNGPDWGWYDTRRRRWH